MSEKEALSRDQGFEFDLGRIGLVVIIPFAFWAFFTTFQGLKDVTRQGADDLFGTAGAFVGSAAILSLMALSSWQLGSDAAAAVAGRRRARGSNVGLIILIPSFLFFLSMSTFFSYTYYHSNFFGMSSKQMEAERQPRALGNIVIPIVDGVVTNAKKDQIEGTLGSQGAKDWVGGIDTLVKAAGAGGKKFENLAEESARKVAADEAVRLRNVNAARDQIAAIKVQLVEQQRILKAANDIIEPYDKDIVGLRETITKEEQAARASELGLDKSKRPTCGTICESHKENAKKARSELNRIEAALKESRDRKQAALKKIDDLNLKLPELERIAGNNVPGAGPPGTRTPSSAITSVNIRDQVGVLAAARESFLKEPSIATVNNVGTNCKTFLATARELGAVGDLSADFDCTIRTDDAKLRLDDLEKFRREEAVYKQQCGLSQGLGTRLDIIASDVRAKKIEPPEALVQARKLLQLCSDQAIKTTGQSAGLEAAYAAMDKFVFEQSLDRNRFANATSHLRDFDGDARLALSVALAQDLLILIFKFLSDYYKYSSQPRRAASVGAIIDLSDKEGAPAEIRARTALLRLAKPFRSNSCRISEEDIRREQLPQEVEANLMGLINGFGRKDLLWQAGKGVFAIDNEALHQVETALERAAGGGASAGDGRLVSAHGSGEAAEHPEGQAPSNVSDKLQPSVPARPARRSIRDLAGAAISKRLGPKIHDEPPSGSSDPAPPANYSRSSDGVEAQRSTQPAHGFDQLRKLRS